jgi:hypothetical protein
MRRRELHRAGDLPQIFSKVPQARSVFDIDGEGPHWRRRRKRHALLFNAKGLHLAPSDIFSCRVQGSFRCGLQTVKCG